MSFFHTQKNPSQFALMLGLLLGITTLTSCYSVKRTVEASRPYSAKIAWPAAYLPEESVFFVHNEIDIQATPQQVWDVLIQAATWEQWYEGAEDFRFEDDNTTGNLEENSIFSWKTMGQYFTSTIQEFEPPYRLAWESDKDNIRGYHAWLIIPMDQGCKLITSEAQHGFMASMEKVFVPNKLRKFHDIWLAEIKKKAENQ